MGKGVQELLQQLATRHPLPPLGPTKIYSSDITREIDSLVVGKGVKAALHLLNDDIDRCHKITQSNEGVPTFDYLHAVLHRREKDYWNSKWWFNRIDHPLLPLLYATTTAQDFVDATDRAEKGKDVSQIAELQKKQMEEMVKIAEYAIEQGV